MQGSYWRVFRHLNHIEPAGKVLEDMGVFVRIEEAKLMVNTVSVDETLTWINHGTWWSAVVYAPKWEMKFSIVRGV